MNSDMALPFLHTQIYLQPPKEGKSLAKFPGTEVGSPLALKGLWGGGLGPVHAAPCVWTCDAAPVGPGSSRLVSGIFRKG